MKKDTRRLLATVLSVSLIFSAGQQQSKKIDVALPPEKLKIESQEENKLKLKK